MTRSAAASSLAALVLGACLLGLAPACEREGSRSDEGRALSAGVHLVARAETLRAAVQDLASFGEVPLAKLARDRAAALPDCALVVGHGGDLSAALAGARCVTEQELSPPLREALADRGAAILWQGSEENGRLPPPLLAVIEDDPRGLTVDVTVEAPGGAKNLLLPGSDAPAAASLRAADALVYARVLVDGGIHLAALVPEQSQAQDLFRLKSALFSTAVSNGTWELALLPPSEGARVPPIALALGVRSESAGREAMSALLDDTERRWPVHRTPLALHGREGACLRDLNILPELAPCYVSTERAVVIGWNEAALEAALATSPDGSVASASLPEGSLASSSHARLATARFAAADALLWQASGGEGPVPSLTWPWSEIVVTGKKRAGAYQLRLRFERAR